MMKSLLKKRLPGILAAGLVMLAVGAAGIAPASAADATTSNLTKAQKKKKAKALKACNKKRKAAQKKACKKKVNAKYKKIADRQKPKPTPKGKTWKVLVQDPYMYSPNSLSIKVNDFIEWDWKESMGREPHDVSPSKTPSGVNRNDFKSALTVGPDYKFKRQFTKAGDYTFVCTFHYQMTMDVKVSK